MQVSLDDYSTAVAAAVDLANSGPEVRRAGDQLCDLDALRTFLDDHGLPTPRPLVAKDVSAVHRLRNRVRGLIERPELDHLVGGAEQLTATADRLTVVFDETGRSHWAAITGPSDSPADVLGLVCGVGILGVIRTLGLERFRHCSDPVCAGVFIDTSRPGRRRYCLPELCGNRVNVAKHRARQGTASLSEIPLA